MPTMLSRRREKGGQVPISEAEEGGGTTSSSPANNANSRPASAPSSTSSLGSAAADWRAVRREGREGEEEEVGSMRGRSWS